MDIRQASPDDLERCQALSPRVRNTHVWQLRLAHDPITPQAADELGGTLHRSRLPRSIVVGPASGELLPDLWSRAADVLVAEDGSDVVGYVILNASEHGPQVEIARLVVAPAARQNRVGSRMLSAAAQWGMAYQRPTLVGHCSTRNDVAARFYQRWGFRFAGYSEAFYPRGEIALFFYRAL